jgi:hypothetical protein
LQTSSQPAGIITLAAAVVFRAALAGPRPRALDGLRPQCGVRQYAGDIYAIGSEAPNADAVNLPLL